MGLQLLTEFGRVTEEGGMEGIFLIKALPGFSGPYWAS